MCNEHQNERRNPEPSLWPWHVSRSLGLLALAWITACAVGIGYLIGSAT